MAAPSVQYIVVRGDLMKALKWPLGAIIAQACHASSAVMHMFHDDKNTQEYLADIDRMHKVILDGKDEDVLNTLSEALTADGIDHKLWIEQPENICTCIATKPYPKAEIQKYFKGLKLLK